MKTYAFMDVNLRGVARRAQEYEDLGFHGVATVETAHDAFLPLLLAAANTKRLALMTSIAVGFARSPMTLAYLANDLNSFSEGRFSLGIGSQIKPHITRRFSMPWSKPAARMREMVEAINAIGTSWCKGTPLNFEGEFYQHTLMPPVFAPTDTEYGQPPVLVAAVGALMTQTAAEVADGILIHSFSTETYIREVTLPRIEKGLAASGRPRDGYRVNFGPFIVTGPTQEAFDQSKEDAKEGIAFYGSTPAYRPVFEVHGWGELQSELTKLSKEGQWKEMGTLIDDEVLDAFAVMGSPKEIGPELNRRYGDFVDDLTIECEGFDDETISTILGGLNTKQG